MKAKNNVSLAVIFFLLAAVTGAEAELAYSVTDLGTLGGAASQANGVAGHGTNAAGMIVGSSTTSDNSEHAFLYANGQMFDLNTLCDLSTSGFSVLKVATTISDSCLIIGEGITTKGDKHAFLLTPLAVDGGTWSYVCCQWVWIQEGGGWWWESNCGCYKWHGPPGRHPPCPPQPPHCWWFPLPCCPQCPPPGTPPPPPPPPPPPQCWCCINGEVVQTTEADCRERGGKCYRSKEEALKNCRGGPPPPNYPNMPPPPPPPRKVPPPPPPPKLNTPPPPPPPTPTGVVVGVRPTPTSTPTIKTFIPGVRVTPSPSGKRTRTKKGSTTSSAQQNVNPAPHVQSEPTPNKGQKSTRRGKGKPTPTPPPPLR